MEKKNSKIAVVLCIIILHPVIIGSIWFSFTWAVCLLPEALLELILYPYILVEAGMIVLSSELLKWQIEKKQFLYSDQMIKYLIFSNILYMVVVGIATIVSTFLSDGIGHFAASWSMTFTLAVSVFYIIILVYQLTDGFKKLKWDARAQTRMIPKPVMVVSTAIIHPLVASAIWYSFFILMADFNKIDGFMWELLSLVLMMGMCLELFVMVITSVLIYWLMMRNQYLDSIQTKIMLVFSNTLFMVISHYVYSIYPDFLPGGEGPMMGIGIFLYLTLAVTGAFLLFLLIVMLIEYKIRRKTQRSQ